MRSFSWMPSITMCAMMAGFVKRAVYIAIEIDMEGHKDVLGMYVGQNESAKFWLSILNGLKNRGVEDILIVFVDGLTDFLQAIEAVFPDTVYMQPQQKKSHWLNWMALMRNGAGNILKSQNHGRTTGRTFQRILSIPKRFGV